MAEPYIIAEAGNNHNGDVNTALKLVDVAKEIGADCVKFQIINPAGLYLQKYYDNDRLILNDVYKQRERYILNDEEWEKVADHARKADIDFAASVFDRKSMNLLEKLNSEYVKIASCDLNNIPFIKYIATRGIKMIISTGMATLGEIEATVMALKGLDAIIPDVILLHCVSIYPAQLDQTRMGMLDILSKAFGFPIGFSDHTESSLAAVIAISKGVSYLEKHLTLNRNQEGFDHAYAMEPEMFRQYVKDIKEAHASLCPANLLQMHKAEAQIKERARRSIYAARDIQAGEQLHEMDVMIVRPEGPLVPADLEKILGKSLKRRIERFAPITWDNLS